ncbi:hypothetical protein EW146_g9577 [Bondarzewia mesenterica]|uniref:Uncharacterized protein n=1 Tax=Bondarzewia mesenterica TaxID=1095465 RepID=A0A4S4L6X5_9AGAM|nr:hypothetical protein EW146_g9577 [Bondarzewia mesenterica]
MAAIGSVFLGDVQRHRLLSSSTPPSSPPPLSPPHSSMAAAAAHPFPSEIDDSPGTPNIPLPAPTTAPATSMAAPTNPVPSAPPPPPPSPPPPPPTIAPVQSLELRLRWLEALIYGVSSESATSSDRRPRIASAPARERKNGLKSGDTLMRGAEELQRRLDTIVGANDGLRRFIDHCTCLPPPITSLHSHGNATNCIFTTDEQHANLLTPAFALSGTLPTAAATPAYQNMSPSELDAFLAELEPDIRAADRDMREIDALEKKGVTGAGKLPGALSPPSLPLLFPPSYRLF